LKKLLIIFLATFSLAATAQKITVGAKHFNEGYILSEIIAQLLEENDFTVDRKYNLGGTMVCFKALKQGEIDVYPEYTGTISFEILSSGKNLSVEQIRAQLQAMGLAIASPYGFSNTYALVMTEALSKEKSIHNISDLAQHPNLTIGLSYEFLKRQDGWDNLSKAYALPQVAVGLEHGLAYSALTENKIQITDAYATDGEIIQNQLTVLEDNQNFFPDYLATSFYRPAIGEKAETILKKLTGQITESEMQAMNAAVLYEKKSFQQVASDFLRKKGFVAGATSKTPTSIIPDLLNKTGVHLKLTFLALLLAIGFAVPLGIVLYWHPKPARYVLYFVGLLQTIPSIALLAIFIPFTGIGQSPAVLALFLYGLLPILRNTYTGLQGIDPVLKKVAIGMGMNRAQRMQLLEFPLAIPFILSGIRTAAVISVGTATLAAFIGAGGLGEYIVTGLALNNSSLILRGAIPAAILAILIEIAFEILERILRPKYLR